MRILPLFALSSLLIATTAVAEPKWEKKSSSESVTIYNRARPGSGIKELRAEGIIKAPPWVCFNVVDDEGRYAEFMPYTGISKIIEQRKDGSKIVYQRIEVPIISDRDYTMIIRNRSTRLADGKIRYKQTWNSANHLGPEPKSGVVRVQTNEGYWIFEERADRNETNATYFVYADPGGYLPDFIINLANGNAVPGLFEAIGEQAQSDRYRKTRVPVPNAPAETPQPAIPVPEEEAP
jgi:ribosome-associated toxin RatA of RatAB toxin-antitoxin module